MTVDQLTELQQQLRAARIAVERASGIYNEAREARNELVKQAVQTGMRPSEVARLAGPSWTGVAKLSKSRP